MNDGISPPRISIVGNSGSGKTTLARRAAARLGVAHIELDSIFHQPGWQPLDPTEFRLRVEAATSAGGWVADGNYSSVADLIWSRADTVVWLDFPRRTVMRQVVRRTIGRVIRREELWNGNQEPWSNLYRWDPHDNIIRWSWTQHAAYRARYTAAMADPSNARLRFLRLSDRAAAEAWLASLGPVDLC